MWKDCSKQGSVVQCVSVLDLYPVQRSNPSPPALPEHCHQGQELSCWRQTALWTTFKLPTISQRLNEHFHFVPETLSNLCFPLMHTLTTAQPLSIPRFCHRTSCAQWTSGFLISAVVNQQGCTLRRDVQALVKTQHGLNSTLSQSLYIERPFARGRLVKVHVGHNSGRIGWVWEEWMSQQKEMLR